MTATIETNNPHSTGSPQTAPANSWVLPLAVLIAGMFMSTLDISIVNVALPNIQNQFGASTKDAQWVITGYSLAEGVVVPVTAWLGDRLGLTRVYNLAMLGFAGGSALCGLAWSLNTLVISRIVQGLLGGILPAITMSILLRVVPRERFGTALGLYGLGVVFAPAVGPALGGYLVEYVNWRLIFFINIPVGIIGTIAAILVLPSFPKRIGRKFDILGFITVACGLFALLLAVSKGEDWKWSSYRIVGLIIISVLSLALFVVIELEVDDPLLDLRVLRYRTFTHSLVLILLISVALFSVVFLVPQFLQRGQGLKAFDAGLVLLPPALVMAVLMPLSGRIYDRIGARLPATIGLMIAAAASYLLHTITLDTSREKIMWLLALQYGGLGISLMPIFSAGLAAIPTAHSNIASAVSNIVQRVAGAFGVAIFTALLTVQQAQLIAGRSALVPATTRIPHLGPPGTPDWLSVYAVYHQTQQEVFARAIGDLFLLVTVLFALSGLGALLLRSKPAPEASPGPSPSAMEASSPAPPTASPAKHDTVERVPVPTLPRRTPDQPRTAEPVEQIPVTISTTADLHTKADERDEPAVTTVQAKRDRTSERPQTTTNELNTVRTQIDQIREQLSILHQQISNLAGIQTELTAKLKQVKQQRRPTEPTSAQPEPTVSPATGERARNHGEQRLPHQQTRAPGRTGGQHAKLTPSQIKLAQQMYNARDKHGKRRYTTRQIADAFGVTPATIYRHLKKNTSKNP